MQTVHSKTVDMRQEKDTAVVKRKVAKSNAEGKIKNLERAVGFLRKN